MSSFIRGEDGELSITLSTQESHVLINLSQQLLELLSEGEISEEHQDPLRNLLGISDSDSLPDDPVLRRLLPNAYTDEASASEFRRYTEYGLREKKKSHIHTIYEALTNEGEPGDISNPQTPIDKGIINVAITQSEITDWLAGFNDLRLALAVRLGIGGDRESQESLNTKEIHKKYELMLESDPMKAVYAVYSWIGWLQQSLLEDISS